MTPEHFFAQLEVLALVENHALGGDHVLNPEMLEGQKPEALRASLRPAAVLIGVQNRGGEGQIILTQRSAKLRAHSGEIAFPGGRIDASDATPEHAALREANEEIGLPHEAAHLAHTLPDYLSRSGFAITPVIAHIDAHFTPRPNPDEVAEIFTAPLAFLMDLENHQKESLYFEGKDRYFYSIPYQNRRIWGVTAGIIHALALAIAA